MPERSLPASVIWVGALTVLSIAVAVGGGAALYVESREATRTRAEAITRGHVSAGGAAITRYGCGSCHTIPGISGAVGRVGPDLRQVSTRAEIAGSLSNDPETMVRWLMHPQALRPGTGMPEQGVGERDARDIAAYLYTLK